MNHTAHTAALALLEHAKLGGESAPQLISMEVTTLTPMSIVCRIVHSRPDYQRVIIVPLVEVYKSTTTTRNRHITEVLPLQMIFDEYDRLMGEAVINGLFDVHTYAVAVEDVPSQPCEEDPSRP